ncbi:MAG: Diaminopimelate epimerase [Myxococcota bacterium]|nr:Diaminopimelate epimerase [Myxococcota bacterium]
MSAQASRRIFKYHGLGNDFIILDVKSGEAPIDAATAIRWCDRFKGVGADGVLSILPGSKAPFRMHIFNSDGSEAEMCGNGIRCVAKYLFDRDLARGGAVDIETGNGVLNCQVFKNASGVVETVRVHMGRPVLDRERIPMLGAGADTRETIRLGDETLTIRGVSMGNPHMVIYDRATVERAQSAGPALERHELFPRKTNGEFVTFQSQGKFDLVVFERGCGITQACGTGACAATVASVIDGKVPSGREIKVNLPGGSLFIEVVRDLSAVYMRGPAEAVFEGRVLLA